MLDTLHIVSQLGIAILSPTAVFLLCAKQQWGTVIGFLSQPFWWTNSIVSMMTSDSAIQGQWGLLVTNTVFTVIWTFGVWNWLRGRAPKTVQSPKA